MTCPTMKSIYKESLSFAASSGWQDKYVHCMGMFEPICEAGRKAGFYWNPISSDFMMDVYGDSRISALALAERTSNMIGQLYSASTRLRQAQSITDKQHRVIRNLAKKLLFELRGLNGSEKDRYLNCFKNNMELDSFYKSLEIMARGTLLTGEEGQVRALELSKEKYPTLFKIVKDLSRDIYCEEEDSIDIYIPNSIRKPEQFLYFVYIIHSVSSAFGFLNRFVSGENIPWSLLEECVELSLDNLRRISDTPSELLTDHVHYFRKAYGTAQWTVREYVNHYKHD